MKDVDTVVSNDNKLMQLNHFGDSSTDSSNVDLFQHLSTYKIVHELVPDSIYYIPNFITTCEECTLIREVEHAPKPKWTYLGNRSLQNWGGLPHPKGMIAEPLPSWLSKYTKKLGDDNIFDGHQPNHILMNRYLPGQGIMAHEDGPLFYPTVATINTGSHTMLNFYRKPSELASEEKEEVTSFSKNLPIFSLLLWPRSLLVLKHHAYTDYLHEIEELHQDHIVVSHCSESNFTTHTWTVQDSDGGTQRPIVNEIDPELFKNNNVINNNVTAQTIQTLERTTRYSFTIRYFHKVLLKGLNVNKLFGIKNY